MKVYVHVLLGLGGLLEFKVKLDREDRKDIQGTQGDKVNMARLVLEEHRVQIVMNNDSVKFSESSFSHFITIYPCKVLKVNLGNLD